MKSASSTSARIRGVVCLLVAAIFCAAGSAMLLGLPWMVDLFERIGAGQWFRFVTGTLELAGCALLLPASTRHFGALLLLLIMLVAIAAHVFVIGGSPAPAVVLAVACAWLFVRERRRGSDARRQQTSYQRSGSKEAIK
ncbi:DoxX family protein [Cupriavidus oxalaticus]|uniref:DoxX family protein n=1 Tax=Cupriavidus oxalaticus TaxID=96344 RepID=UPI0031828529